MEAQYTDRPGLLIPRPDAQAKDFAAAVERAMPGAWDIVTAPLIEIRFLPGPVPLEGVVTLIFTSANGVAAFCAASARRDLPAICVGARTTEAARRAGFAASTGGASAGELAATLSRQPAGRFLHVRGAHAVGELAATLRAAGHLAEEAILYDQRAVPLPADVCAALEGGLFRAVTLFSPRSAELLGKAVAERGLPGETQLLCISRAAADRAARFHAGPVAVATTPDAEGMLALLRAAHG